MEIKRWFSVGLHGSNIHMLTVYKKTPVMVKITPLDGDVNVSVDRGKDNESYQGQESERAWRIDETHT